MIRELLLCDIPACVEITRTNWGEDIANRAGLEFKQAFTDSPWRPVFFVYEHNDQVVGYAGFQPSMIFSGIYDFIWVNVRDDYQRQDVGSQLTRHRIEEIRKRNGRAIHLMTQKYRFFRRFGFQIAQVYHTQGESPWVLMTLQLEDMALK